MQEVVYHVVLCRATVFLSHSFDQEARLFVDICRQDVFHLLLHKLHFKRLRIKGYTTTPLDRQAVLCLAVVFSNPVS